MNKRRKYTLDEHYFDIIDTQEKAYILGFLYADGYNNERLGQIRITIHSKDISILEFIKDQMNTSMPIKTDCGYIYLTLNSRYLSTILSKLGCHQAKTFTICFPYWLDKSLYRHFIRGYFDGDGCISNSIRDNSSSVSFIGNKRFMEQINEILKEELNIVIFKPYFAKNPNICTIKFGHNKTVSKIKDYLYKDSSFFLKRKYNKFDFYKKKERVSKYNKTEVYELYLLLRSTYKVAKKLNTSNVTISKILNKYYPEVLKNRHKNKCQKLANTQTN